MRKGENAVYQYVLLFPQYFGNMFFIGGVKSRYRVVNGKFISQDKDETLQSANPLLELFVGTSNKHYEICRLRQILDNA